jgi:capsular polysaccharide export protein
MKNIIKYSISKKLIRNINYFLNIKYYIFLDSLSCNSRILYGWGRKNSGLKAMELAKKCDGSFVLLEDGFIRSLGLGVDGSPSFSLVEDDVGIYYDAAVASKLENILNTYDFLSDTKLMEDAKKAIKLINKYNISKYNSAKDIEKNYFKDEDKNRVLIIAQTAGDSSLEYGMLDNYTTEDIIKAACEENPNSLVYIKIHPDVFSGKKESDIDSSSLDSKIKLITEDFNPISLLKYFDTVYTKTSGMGFEALLVGCKCVCFGMPYYAGWGITDDRSNCYRRKRKLSVEEVFAGAYILYTRYYNPYKKTDSNIIDTINTINKYRNIELQNQGRLFFFGFSKWKRSFMKPFFKSSKNEIFFCDNLKQAIAQKINTKDKVFIWGMKENKDLFEYCKDNNIKYNRVEDGFIRSISLGSDLTKPYSLVVDTRGIYIDPRSESDLENIYNTYKFDEEIKTRAKKLIEKIIEAKFSKYNGIVHKKLQVNNQIDQKVVLIPGQVEDDASIIYGGMGMSTLKLLQEVRKKNPNEYIIFKPHPDVMSDNRIGLKDKNIIMKYVDELITDVSIDSCLEVADEVHTITSTVGYEALLRGIKVHTYGLPFYAGWGLTSDKFTCERRTRNLDILELVSGAIIVYPRYISPKTNELCEVEVAFDEMLEMQEKYFNNTPYKLLIDTKTFLLRRMRRMIEFFLKLVGKR